MRYFIGAAWPYANGPLHIGHVAGCYLPCDIFARFHRMFGDEVLMVSGSDQHGTPITVTANAEGVEPEVIAERYHRINTRILDDLGVTFDLFFQTHHPNHAEVAQDMFLKLKENGHIYEKELDALYCAACDQFLPDRYVEGECPHCGYGDARGDQCDECGRPLNSDELVSPRCKLCGAAPELKRTRHFFLALSGFQERLEEWVADKDHWRPNTIGFTRNWLNEGVRDRAITRDLKWGVDVPLEGYDEKRIYVWFEAVIGYLSTAKEWARRTGDPDAWKRFWQDPECRHYYFLAKDNIPFHTIVWPAELMGYGGLNLPYDVPSNEYLSFKGLQFSKSRGHVIYVDDFLERFSVDALRYYLSVNMPERKDTDFTWEDFVAKNNNELVSTLGNFINRTLTFAVNNFGGVPPMATDLSADDTTMIAAVEKAYDRTGKAIAECRFKDGMREVMALAQEGNRYLMVREPWKLVKSDMDEASTVVHTACRVVKALDFLMAPFLPHSADRLYGMLGEDGSVHDRRWDEGLEDIEPRDLKKPDILFTVIDLEKVLADGEDGGDDAPEGSPAEEAAPQEMEEKEMISMDYLNRLELKVGEILFVEKHPDADKLYVMKVDLGGDDIRQIVAGMKPYYQRDDMVGKKVVIVANLKPAKLRGVRSEGMLLAAQKDGVVSMLMPDPGKEIKSGAEIH